MDLDDTFNLFRHSNAIMLERFDHANENHVHLESDFDVCVSCGALAECPHDSEGRESFVDGTPSPATAKTMALRPDDNLRKQPGSPQFDLPQDQDNTCDMVSNLPIMAGTEVFNTYGERLSNASLLVRYGFMIDGNEWDSVHWTIDNLLSFLSSFSEGLDLVALWKSTPHLPGDTWTGSSLVYHHCSDSKDDLGQQGTSPDRNILCLNGDGKINHRLWTFCALVMIHQRDRLRRSESQDIHAALTRLAIRQLKLERRTRHRRTDTKA
ncbi:hypothetical protein NEOLEDRAFT_60528 [Neolentinus lepideus HHB14362 ss-1]|uniref:SET domain-containing protein n=1 Tax=Neolentinus lepideus HHB14362 ss-1 TaxID=1314782 RepID=A0A165U802_9AGAM|nr:hypothetical protein NEOLEDRAFT_60528 [Neolentinus lepideus HHB14362 ss-1]